MKDMFTGEVFPIDVPRSRDRLANALMRGTGAFFLLKSPRAFQNSVAIGLEDGILSVRGTWAFGSRSTHAWAALVSLLHGLTETIVVLWGAVATEHEFELQNVRRDVLITPSLLEPYQQVGTDPTRGLPGLYSYNYFGPAWTRLIGRGRLRASRFALEDAGRGVFLDGRSCQVNDRVGLDSETIRREKRRIGSRYFFDIRSPDRAVKCPTFRGVKEKHRVKVWRPRAKALRGLERTARAALSSAMTAVTDFLRRGISVPPFAVVEDEAGPGSFHALGGRAGSSEDYGLLKRSVALSGESAACVCRVECDRGGAVKPGRETSGGIELEVIMPHAGSRRFRVPFRLSDKNEVRLGPVRRA